MTILDDLFDNLPSDTAIRSVLVGAHWTAVCSHHCGLAATLLDEHPHGHSRVRDVGRLHLKSAWELAEYARSENPLEASLGMAAINSLLDVDTDQCVEFNAGEVLAEYGRAKNVALVGHFPFIPQLQQTARQLWVIEQRPTDSEYLAEAATDLIPQAEVVAITGTALINHTLDGLLSLCQPTAFVMVLGPSTPLSPVLFRHGVTLLSGTQVVDEAAAIRTIGQAAIFRQIEGVRLISLSVERL